MKIGLVTYECRNGDTLFNMSQIRLAAKNNLGATLLCFGEAFLQGFDAFKWDYSIDKTIAITKDSLIMKEIESYSKKYNVDLLFGYLEKDGEYLYSSSAFIENGKLVHNYRRISKGWKEYSITDYHYKEGTNITTFQYKSRSITLALCGDMWTTPEKFTTSDILIWPVYVSFSKLEFMTEKEEYALQSRLASNNVVMVNVIMKKPLSHGGAFYFKNGKIKKELSFDKEDIMYVDL